MKWIDHPVYIEDKRIVLAWWLSRALLLRLCIIICAMPFLGGCLFWSFSGDGPVGRDEAYRMVGRAPKKMTAEDRKQAMKLYDKVCTKPGFPERKDRVTTTAWGSVCASMLTLGFDLRFDTVSAEKPGALGNSLYLSDKAFIPGYPIIWPWWSEWVTTYNIQSDEELGELSMHGIGIGSCLGGYACEVMPEKKHKRPPFVPSSYGDAYNVKTSYHLLFGAFAKGRVNHREYMQLFWIPIPLGAVADPD